MIDLVLDLQLPASVPKELPTEQHLESVLEQCLQHLGIAKAEVCIRVVDIAEIQQLNHQYRGLDKATNVLSFSNGRSDEEGRILLGDIVICQDIVVSESEAQGKPIEAHFTHLIIHGLLHLQGYDHSEDDQAVEMESTEITLMKSLGYGDPYVQAAI